MSHKMKTGISYRKRTVVILVAALVVGIIVLLVGQSRRQPDVFAPADVPSHQAADESVERMSTKASRSTERSPIVVVPDDAVWEIDVPTITVVVPPPPPPPPAPEPTPEPTPEPVAEPAKKKPVTETPVTSAVPSGESQTIAHDMVLQRGWDENEFSCLVSLWQKESGWRVDAANASSGAYGIPQALPGSKMASAGEDWQTNPATQITWGLDYIAGRYATPCGAWSAFQSKGWY